MTNQKFPEDAIIDMANTIEEQEDKDDTIRGQTSIFNDIAEISNYHDIPTEERVDFAVAGMERMVERKKQQAISDFREILESLSRVWEDE